MDRIDSAQIEACVERSIRLLQRTFRAGDTGGGWYHDLESGPPGPSATAAGLAAMSVIAGSRQHVGDAYAFLKARQCRSGQRLTDGGWAVNTSNGVPVAECTALVAWLLARGGVEVSGVVPDLRRAAQWLSRNQNPDGGWGSFLGQPSRTWLTAMSIRALNALRTGEPEIERGTAWLREHREEDGGWGEVPGAPVTVTHTAFVLCVLRDARVDPGDPALRQAYAWLLRHLDPQRLHDDAARHESYNVRRTAADGSVMTWVSAVWHAGLPYAVSALVRSMDTAAVPALFAAVGTLVREQRADGRWPGAGGAARLSMWDVWPHLDALHDVATMRLSWPGDVLVPLPHGAILVQRASVRDLDPVRLFAGLRRRRWRGLLRRHWATGILVLSVGGGVLATLADLIQVRDLVLGLLLPVVLLFVQAAVRPPH